VIWTSSFAPSRGGTASECNSTGRRTCHFVLADYVQIDRVVSNLLENAIRFAPSQSSIDIEVRTDSREMTVAVTNPGPAIPRRLHPHLFDKFYRISEDRSPSMGTGLGLSICKGIVAAPFYGVGVFMPIMVMGQAIRQHILQHYTGRVRTWGALGAGFAALLSATVFVGQIVGKWEDGGWIRLVSFAILFAAAHLLLLSPLGNRTPKQIHRIVREKARVQGAMASIVEWQSLQMQEYRYLQEQTM